MLPIKFCFTCSKHCISLALTPGVSHWHGWKRDIANGRHCKKQNLRPNNIQTIPALDGSSSFHRLIKTAHCPCVVNQVALLTDLHFHFAHTAMAQALHSVTAVLGNRQLPKHRYFALPCLRTTACFICGHKLMSMTKQSRYGTWVKRVWTCAGHTGAQDMHASQQALPASHVLAISVGAQVLQQSSYTSLV